MPMLRKKEIFTIITPIPGFIPRQLAIDILHAHSEVITLNPLVIDHKPIPAPRDAASDEYYSTWYEITERIQYVPGLGKMGSGKIAFNGCFHDMPWGLQTHIYAPMNIDLRNKYRIAGNQPGVEAPEATEIGLAELGAPSDGLYLREDIEIKCNITMVSFVKAQLKAAGKEMVSRIIKKAELLDAGVLHAMIEDGKLKTVNPLDRSGTVKTPGPLPSPTGTFSTVAPSSPGIPYQVPRPQSTQYVRPGSRGYAGSAHSSPHPSPGYPPPAQVHYAPQELQGSEATPAASFAPVEMPGDYYHPSATGSPHLQPASARDSSRSSSGPWSANDVRSSQASSRPTSISSTTSTPQQGGGAFHSPGLDHKGFSSELAPHAETNEEHRAETLKKLDPRASYGSQKQPPSYSYNPADYAKLPMAQQVPPPGQHPSQHHHGYNGR